MKKQPVLLMIRALSEGGCERDLTRLALNLDRTRFEPHVGSFQDGIRKAELEAAGVPILHLPITSFGNRSCVEGARKMGAYLRQHQIRLVHAFDVPLDVFAAPVARRYGVPAVITSQLSFRTLYSLGTRLALRLSDRLSRRVVVNSRAVGDSLHRDYGIPDEKIFLCYNGVDTTQFYPEPEKQHSNRPAALREASVVIGTICVMRPEKRVDWLVRAFSELLPLDPQARLLLVGSGPETGRLTDLCDSLGVRDACHFEPSQTNVAPWLRGLDIYVNSSSSESFPNGLLEAMACGCCVIGSKVGGIPELVTHGQDGLVFDAGEQQDLTAALRMAATDAGLRGRLRKRAAQTARERFAMQLTAGRMEALYEDLLAGSTS
ncbi:MAG TPA: glycosyltransferase family 4 protein [Bryobacteraceae bacterium]|nr:glycosyltransferase family 4 protein [Bryobacteraceae bacterium]